MPESGNDNPAEDLKRKFREALDRKNHKNVTSTDHKDALSKATGTQGSASHKREFRRKSG